MSSPWPRTSAVKTRKVSILKTFFLVVVCGLLFGAGMAYVAWHYANQNQEADLAPETAPAQTASRSEPAALPPRETTSEPAAAEQPKPGGWYRVKVETAYFFDQPEQSAPSGRYLRRGDEFYGQGETNGFVKAGFVQPNGAAGTGWLRLDGLAKLSSSASRPTASRRTVESVPTRQPATPAPTRVAAKPRPAAPVPVPGSSAGAQTAVVQVAKSYFYNTPELAEPRKAHCVRGDRVRLGEVRGEAVYVTFTNWEKVTTTGWMRLDALQ